MGNQMDQHELTNLKNILILSFGFMLLMASWYTTSGIEQSVLQSVKVDDPTFTGDGYLSQSIVNGMFAVTNFLAPMIVNIVGVRTSMVVGSCFYVIFTANFLYPSSWLLYGSSVCIGFGSACVWIANGVYFTRCCTKENIGKYMGMYWAIMSLGQLLGNAFVFWKFQGKNHIDHETRFLVISTMTCVAIMASVTFIFLGRNPESNKKKGEISNKSIFASIMEPFYLFGNKHMLLLIPAAMYNGLELGFLTMIYPTSVAFSEAFGGDTRKLVGVVGILVGVGTMMGGLVFGYVVAKYVKSKRTFTVISSCMFHCIALLLMYLNLPNAAPLGPTRDISWINPPSIPIAMLCAFLLGLGDGCISPQICAAIGVIWPEDPSAAYAIYRFILGGTLAMGYFISTLTGFYNQILIFCTITLLGTFSFCINERLISKMTDFPANTFPTFVDAEQITVPDRKSSET